MNSELRQDLISGDWILIAPGRAKRLGQFTKKRERRKTHKSDCPFEDPVKAGGGSLIALYKESAMPLSSKRENWRIQIVPNKYPAVTHNGTEAKLKKKGIYSTMAGVGYHELVITRDHNKDFPRLKRRDANLVFKAFRDRYLTLLNDKELAYVSIFHNWGHVAGASVYHPHYQIIALPVVPPDIEHSLNGSKRYFKENKICIHCLQIKTEKMEKKRVIFENEGAIAFAPFVSRSEFEIRIFPKKHMPFFEDTPIYTMDYVAEALQKILAHLGKALNNPGYNFFIHTAPIKKKNKNKHYHWHIEVHPKITTPAGFELGTGIEINVIDPDEAARFIKRYV